MENFDKEAEDIIGNIGNGGTGSSNKINYVDDGEGNKIPVPEGFTHTEGTKNEGLVIKNDKDNNEFVWVPVAGMSYSYERHDFGGYSLFDYDFSYAWDTALKFMETTGSSYPTNGLGGNYTKNLEDTGYDTAHPCNIYDMGGNVNEWSQRYIASETPFSLFEVVITMRKWQSLL